MISLSFSTCATSLCWFYADYGQFYIYIFCSIYYTDDDEYKYKIEICQKSLESVAVQQWGKKWTSDKSWVNVGTYDGAHVTGGSKYNDHTFLGNLHQLVDLSVILNKQKMFLININ